MAYGVSWQKITNDPGSEEQQGKNLVDAALENGVQCFVWSTLPSSRHISGGRFVSRIYEGYIHATHSTTVRRC